MPARRTSRRRAAGSARSRARPSSGWRTRSGRGSAVRADAADLGGKVEHELGLGVGEEPPASAGGSGRSRGAGDDGSLPWPASRATRWEPRKSAAAGDEDAHVARVSRARPVPSGTRAESAEPRRRGRRHRRRGRDRRLVGRHRGGAGRGPGRNRARPLRQVFRSGLATCRRRARTTSTRPRRRTRSLRSTSSGSRGTCMSPTGRRCRCCPAWLRRVGWLALLAAAGFALDTAA